MTELRQRVKNCMLLEQKSGWSVHSEGTAGGTARGDIAHLTDHWCAVLPGHIIGVMVSNDSLSMGRNKSEHYDIHLFPHLFSLFLQDRKKNCGLQLADPKQQIMTK